MRELTFREALREALRDEMRQDSSVFLLGEDIGRHGGAHKVTEGLLDEFGANRVMDMPISESAIIGAAVGAAIMGMRPVAEIMFADFLTVAMDQIVNNAAKMCYIHDGDVSVPMVVRGNCGAGTRMGVHHGQSFEAWFAHIPGLKVVMPSTPADAKGLMKSAIRDCNPVIFHEHKLLYGTKGPVPEGDYLVPLGKADVKREGTDATVVATGVMLNRALGAAKQLQEEGISVEVVDVRTIQPLDTETIVASACKTGRVIIAQEAPGPFSAASEIAAVIGREAFGYLDMPIEMVCEPFVPVPFSPILEDFVIPREGQIISAVKRVLKQEA
ncbi:MAG TPA: alpha-ketoacid dehydrogenase subunit beta [Candidatus Methylomirabilis sp.]|nr:alpha-ketoacid dehydrogenase subunit beta [Candidatus Methylomirabilis sp.]